MGADYRMQEENEARRFGEEQTIRHLRAALADLLEQIDSLDGVDLSRDTDEYKAEACWNDAIEQAHRVLKETEHYV
jgi:hypothetical protein